MWIHLLRRGKESILGSLGFPLPLFDVDTNLAIFLPSYFDIWYLSSLVCWRGHFLLLFVIFGDLYVVHEKIHSEWYWSVLLGEGNQVLCWIYPGRRFRGLVGVKERVVFFLRIRALGFRGISEIPGGRIISYMISSSGISGVVEL